MKPIIMMTDSKPYMDDRVEIIHLPFIGIEVLPMQPIKHHYDWLIFTSKNAVDIFFEQYSHVTFDKIAAIGIKTKEVIETLGYLVHFVPTAYNQESFIEEMGDLFHNCTVCLPISSKARPKMFNALKSYAVVDKIDLYQPQPNINNIQKAKQLIEDNAIDWITFMSPSSVEASRLIDLNSTVKVMAIGKVTSKALEQHNINHYVSKLETKISMIETILSINEEKGE